MNISETDINAVLITCSVQTKSEETTTEEGGMNNGIWGNKWQIKLNLTGSSGMLGTITQEHKIQNVISSAVSAP